MAEDRLGFIVVDLDSAADDFFISNIWSTLQLGPLGHTGNKGITVLADQVDDAKNIDVFIEDPGLLDTAWNAIQKKQV